MHNKPMVWLEVISQVAQRRSFEVKRSSEYAFVHMSTHTRNARTLNLPSRSPHYSCSQRGVGAQYQTHGSSSDLRAERCKSQNTSRCFLILIYTLYSFAQSYLLRPIIKHRSCKQTEYKNGRETLFIFTRLLAHTKKLPFGACPSTMLCTKN